MHTHDSGVCSSLESTDRHILVKVKMGAMSLVHDQENVSGLAYLSDSWIVRNKTFHVGGCKVDYTDV